MSSDLHNIISRFKLALHPKDPLFQIGREAIEAIEALEGEVAAQRDRATVAQHHLAAAEARAERLRVALEEIAELEPDSTAWSVEHARKALEDDKQ